MKLYKFSFALMLGIGTLTSCSDKLELTNPNDPTTGHCLLSSYPYGGYLRPCRLYFGVLSW